MGDDKPDFAPTPDEFEYALRLSQLISQGADEEEMQKAKDEYLAQVKAYAAWMRSGRKAPA
jgi:hypothetical protein